MRVDTKYKKNWEKWLEEILLEIFMDSLNLLESLTYLKRCLKIDMVGYHFLLSIYGHQHSY
jgi:hypothetical protein